MVLVDEDREEQAGLSWRILVELSGCITFLEQTHQSLDKYVLGSWPVRLEVDRHIYFIFVLPLYCGLVHGTFVVFAWPSIRWLELLWVDSYWFEVLLNFQILLDVDQSRLIVQVVNRLSTEEHIIAEDSVD